MEPHRFIYFVYSTFNETFEIFDRIFKNHFGAFNVHTYDIPQEIQGFQAIKNFLDHIIFKTITPILIIRDHGQLRDKRMLQYIASTYDRNVFKIIEYNDFSGQEPPDLEIGAYHIHWYNIIPAIFHIKMSLINRLMRGGLHPHMFSTSKEYAEAFVKDILKE